MQAMNFKHQERLQKEENKHNEAVLKEQHRHEEYIISEQRKVLEKILEVTLTAYAKKLDFLQAQMNCISETYQQELKLINENISFLEHEKIKIKDNMDLYMEFSRDVRECYKSKDELTKAYNEANRNITTAMQCVKLEESFDSKLQQTAAQLQQITNRGGK